MAKAEMNNEIVLLRHTVRQARVCVIHKLIKEARHLRLKHGTETQQEKYKRKADRLIDEIYALKTIKDDDISKFGIINERELSEILQDPASTNDIRIKARVVYYKTLHRRLMQFEEKYPDCKTYLMEKKKKTANLKTNNAPKTRYSARKNNNSAARDKTPRKQAVGSNRESAESSQNDSEGEKVCEAEATDVRNTRSSRKKRKKSTSDEGASSNEGKMPKLGKEVISEESVADERPSTIEPRSVTKEGTVKRFTELLEEQETTEDAQTRAEGPKLTASERAKSVDDFFIIEDNENYRANSSTSVGYEKSHQYNTRTKVPPRSNNRAKRQNGNDAASNKKYPDKQSSGTKLKRTTGNKSANKAADKEETANLHPSWRAKKKEREMIKQGFQGKKIVFTNYD